MHHVSRRFPSVDILGFSTVSVENSRKRGHSTEFLFSFRILHFNRGMFGAENDGIHEATHEVTTKKK